MLNLFLDLPFPRCFRFSSSLLFVVVDMETMYIGEVLKEQYINLMIVLVINKNPSTVMENLFFKLRKFSTITSILKGLQLSRRINFFSFLSLVSLALLNELEVGFKSMARKRELSNWNRLLFSAQQAPASRNRLALFICPSPPHHRASIHSDVQVCRDL